MAAESSILVNYVPAKQPQLDGGDAVFLRKELQRISTSINLLNQVVAQIDQRLIAHGW